MRHAPESLERSDAKNRSSRARTRGADRAPTPHASRSQSLDRLIAKARRLDVDVAMWLMVHPSARIAHHRFALLDALQREKAALDEEAAKAAAREARRADNAADRARRGAEPHELRAAARMGFGDDVLTWRRYIDEREAHGPGFMSPEEWRAAR